ncbi:D-3-phosphoglycerate dehydrogenase [Sarcoptes scabiei]|uniref:D-3-phosphoglycerate dehydrogenase n=1 Tax=Sarcoptes scabiei TaxID=52283 RepID=A0A834RED3_SARSC|nr:D-3-phosphoglycerate dehydrogenase [Sarcoptes scabiei]
MILTTSRHVAQACHSLKQNVWDRKSFMGNEIKGKTLAIIGLGRIGREVAFRMQSFGMRTIGFDPIVTTEQAKSFGVESMSLDEIWPQADYITVHTPLIPQTKNLINAKTLAKCRKGVRIINVARGGIVNENDLLDALKSGQCAGAGLDVFQEEPPTNTDLIKHPLVVCTPHLGASTKEAQINVAKEIAEQFIEIINGKSVPGVVNAPLLSEMLQHRNLIWIRLGKNLGRLVATNHNKTQSFKVTIDGFEASKVSKLIFETIMMGFLSVKTGSEVKMISVSKMAEKHSISGQLMIGSDKCCFSSVTVETVTGEKFVGIPQGRRTYLAEMNGHRFEPVILMEGNLSLLQFKSNKERKLSELFELFENEIISVTRSNCCTNESNPIYCLHSKKSLNFKSILDDLVFVDQLEF